MQPEPNTFMIFLKKTWGRINAGICFLFALGVLALGIDMAQGDVGADAWVGMVFMLAMILLTGRVAWKHLYKNPRRAQQRSRDEKLRQIVHLAAQNQGGLSALETAMDIDIDIDESKELLDYLVDKGVALMHVNEQGNMIFNFPDLQQQKMGVSLPRERDRRNLLP